MNLEKKDIIEILENAFCFIVVMAMFIYGGAKIFQFVGAFETNKRVSEMTGMQLMWAFYGYSKPFAITLGVLEIIGGILMLIKRTRVLGCLLVSTILVNVILQDIFYEVHIGALRAALIYQFLILLIFWFNREKLVQSIKLLINTPVFDNSKKAFFVKMAFSIILFVILRILEFYLTTKW
jgi:hypothetical protein